MLKVSFAELLSPALLACLTPVYQEYSLPGYLTGGPGGGPMQIWDDFGLTVQQGGDNDYNVIWIGPETYRPNFNAYMIAGAHAISTVANLTGK